MLLWIWLMVLALAVLLFLIWIRYFELNWIGFAGALLFFFLSLTLFVDGLDYKVGETTNFSYVCSDPCATPGGCSGQLVHPTCDFYDGDETGCGSAGCNWDTNTSLCFGTPNECTSFRSSESCEVISGCTWANATSSTNSTLLSNTLKNDVYNKFGGVSDQSLIPTSTRYIFLISSIILLIFSSLDWYKAKKTRRRPNMVDAEDEE